MKHDEKEGGFFLIKAFAKLLFLKQGIELEYVLKSTASAMQFVVPEALLGPAQVMLSHATGRPTKEISIARS